MESRVKHSELIFLIELRVYCVRKSTGELHRLARCFKNDIDPTCVTFTHHGSGPIYETSAQSMELSGIYIYYNIENVYRIHYYHIGADCPLNWYGSTLLKSEKRGGAPLPHHVHLWSLFICRGEATVLRHIFVHFATFSSTFAAFPRPSCCMYCTTWPSTKHM